MSTTNLVPTRQSFENRPFGSLYFLQHNSMTSMESPKIISFHFKGFLLLTIFYFVMSVPFINSLLVKNSLNYFS